MSQLREVSRLNEMLQSSNVSKLIDISELSEMSHVSYVVLKLFFNIFLIHLSAQSCFLV